jgi:hypothetical protein
MSKGSKQRPTDKKSFDDNYDKIFNKKKPVEKPKDPSFVGFYDDMGRELENDYV